MIAKLLALSLLTVAVPAQQRPLDSLPAILQPQLHDGEQLRYQRSFLNVGSNFSDRLDEAFAFTITDRPDQPLGWLQHYTEGPRVGNDTTFYSGSDGLPLNAKTNKKTYDESFLYNRLLFGDPPSHLVVGVRWRSYISGVNPLGPPFGIMDVEVAALDPSENLVSLRLAFNVNADIRYPADHGSPTYISHDVSRITGLVTFKDGIMMSLTSQGSHSHDMSNGKRILYTTKQTTTLAQ